MHTSTLAKYIAAIAALGIIGMLVYSTVLRGAPSARACTMEAKICPDGSAVGRTGPQCEFAACPHGDALFRQQGTIVFNDNMPQPNGGVLVYMKDGAEIHKNFVFDEHSRCGGAGQFIPCVALNVSLTTAFAGTEVTLAGIDRGADLLVRTLEVFSSAGGSGAMRTTVHAHLGEKVSALGLTIAPEEVVEDSRCPQDVQCIQAGTVRLTATLMSGMGTAPVTFTFGEPITSEAEIVTLVGVTPAPRSTAEIKNSSYVFTFEVAKR